MKLSVFYPSGRTIVLSGEWKGPSNIDGTCVLAFLLDTDVSLLDQGSPTVLEAGSAVILDLRAFCQDAETGAVVYNPRDYMDGMSPWAVTWLEQHPEWPAILEVV